jgi:chemotaxis signal transduction protein
MAEIGNAWLLDIGTRMQVAVAEKEIVEYQNSLHAYPIPVTPRYCSSVVFWRDYQLPLFNLALLTTQQSFKVKTERLAVLAYQNEPKSPLRYIGVALYAPPEKIKVNDDDACDWPEDFSEIWKPLTLALFIHKGITIPVLDIAGLCAGNADAESPIDNKGV